MAVVDGGNAFSTFGDETPETPSGVPVVEVPGGYSEPSYTVADVLRAAKRQFGDESGVQIEDADILSWINEAQLEINKVNKVLKASSNAPSTADQPDYTFPPLGIQQVESLHYDGLRLHNMSLSQVEEAGFDTDASGNPEIWYEWGGRFSLWPRPDKAGVITLYYTVRPAKVTTVSSKLSLPDKYYNDIVRYVLKQAYQLDEDWQAAQAVTTEFQQSIADMGEEERTAQNMTYQTITILD